MRATSEDRKREVIDGLSEVRAAILKEASRLPAKEQDVVFLGIWSIKDLLAHLAGWDVTNLKASKEILKGRVPEFYGHYDRDWQTYNARLVKKYRRQNFAELTELVRDSHKRLIDYLMALPADKYTLDTGARANGYKVLIIRLLQAELKDEKTHLQQILDFKSKL